MRALAKRFDREPVDSKLLLRDSKPFVTKEKPGRRLRQVLAVRDLFRSLKTHVRARSCCGPEAVPPTSDARVGRRRDRDPPRPEQALPLRRDEAAAHVRRRHRAVAVSDAARPLRDHRQVAEPVVVSARVRLGEGRRADPARPGEPARDALDGDLRAGGRHPRHARPGLDRLLGLARVHPHADPRGRVALQPGRHRHAGLHPS